VGGRGRASTVRGRDSFIFRLPSGSCEGGAHPVVQGLRATAAGLRLQTVRELRVGYELQEPFPGSDTFYSQWHGLPIVLVVRAEK
jgi:hypothetical protein